MPHVVDGHGARAHPLSHDCKCLQTAHLLITAPYITRQGWAGSWYRFALTTQANPLLHQMFGYTPREDPAERLTRFEKRLYRSPNSAAAKQLTQHRKSNRADAAARKGNAFGQSEW